jgi:hypothetical protein
MLQTTSRIQRRNQHGRTGAVRLPCLQQYKSAPPLVFFILIASLQGDCSGLNIAFEYSRAVKQGQEENRVNYD